MKVTLKVDTIIKDVRSKSHLEVSGIADPSARYRVEAGTEKLSEVRRDIAGAVSTMVAQCYRFLDNRGTSAADNTVGENDIVLDVSASPRRMDGKEKAVAQKLHEIVVDLTLQRFYVSVAQIDLSRAHDSQANSEIAELEAMLHRKRPPKYLDR